ncbi:MAG: T9SS type A sorting domain-containing protein, partial [Bacteroidales bacterium]|nr:T9SS type A sorting domain-containing protein [Bacteroidales bacterium]
PVMNCLRVEVAQANTVLRVYNLLGELCHQSQVDAVSEVALPSGLYIVRLQNDAQDLTQKIMVK